MHILFVTSLFGERAIGGAEASVDLIARAHVARGGRATVLSLGDRERRSSRGGLDHREIPLANRYWPWDRRPRSAVERLDWHARDAWNPVMAHRVRRAVVEIRPDLVQFHNLKGFSAAVVPAARRCGVPTVQVCHDYYPACARCVMQRGETPCARPCRECRIFSAPGRRASRRHDAAIGVGREMFDRLLAAGCFAGVPRLGVIADPVALPDRGSYAGGRPAEAPGAPLRLGFMGRLEPVKGLETLIDALARLPRGTARLAVAGTGEAGYLDGLRRRAEGLPVTFLGHRPAADVLDGLDLMVVPSIWAEPFGRVTAEAQAHGVPVAASAIGGSLDLIEPGRTGFLFPPGDADALAALLRRLAEDPGALAAVAARARAEAPARRPHATLDAFHALWRDILGRRSATGADRRPEADALPEGAGR
ncbi:MAG: glycosyltransferase family 4 protein [Azospirillaceae bacterium]